MFRLKDATLVR